MMSNNTDIRISKYLSGNMEPDEEQQFLNWVKSDPAHEMLFRHAKKIWEESGKLKRVPVADADLAWQDLMSRTEKPLVRSRVPVWQLAAGIAFLLSLSALILLYTGSESQAPQLVSVDLDHASGSTPLTPGSDLLITYEDSILDTDTMLGPEVLKNVTRKSKGRKIKNVVMITVTTGDSAKAFLLPDQSIVYLNDHSSLTYPENLGKNNRKLSLTGEAYFEVKRDTMQFVVACMNTITRGVDGSFNIRSLRDPAEVEVIVVSGSAEFSGVGKKEYRKLELRQGERGIYDANEQLSKSSVVRKDYKWWQKKGLKARFKKLLDKIRKTFH